MARRKKIIEAETRLGKQLIDTSKVVNFPKGLIGYEDKHQFTLLKIREDSPFLILQSLDDPKLGLLVGDPFSFIEEYSIRIGDAEQDLLGVKSAEELAVLVTVTIPHGRPEQTSLNLTGPILINHEARVGLQVPQADANPPRLMLRLYTQESPAGEDKNQDRKTVQAEGAEASAPKPEVKKRPKKTMDKPVEKN